MPLSIFISSFGYRLPAIIIKYTQVTFLINELQEDIFNIHLSVINISTNLLGKCIMCTMVERTMIWEGGRYSHIYLTLLFRTPIFCQLMQ